MLLSGIPADVEAERIVQAFRPGDVAVVDEYEVILRPVHNRPDERNDIIRHGPDVDGILGRFGHDSDFVLAILPKKQMIRLEFLQIAQVALTAFGRDVNCAESFLPDSHTRFSFRKILTLS